MPGRWRVAGGVGSSLQPRLDRERTELGTARLRLGRAAGSLSILSPAGAREKPVQPGGAAGLGTQGVCTGAQMKENQRR